MWILKNYLLKSLTQKKTKNYKIILKEYETEHNKPLKPVNIRKGENKVPKIVSCHHCEAPHQYIYYNEGKKRSQFRCKVCENPFPVHKRLRKNHNSKYYCPYCGNALYRWKQKKKITIYKCCNRKCSRRIDNLSKLNPSEKFIQKMFPTHFTINYIYREYRLTDEDIKHAAPKNLENKIFRIYNSKNVLGLILAFYVSFAISGRKTSFILQHMFKIKVSYQTVLNYAKAAAYYCHTFNLQHKGPIDDKSAGDETYVKIGTKKYSLFLFISATRKSITAYHLADHRGAIPAIAAINKAVRTAEPEQDITCITDGNPSYAAAILFLLSKPPISNAAFTHKFF